MKDYRTEIIEIKTKIKEFKFADLQKQAFFEENSKKNMIFL